MKAASKAAVAAGVGIMGYLVVYGIKAAQVELKHFTPREFGPWWPMMDGRLLRLLDEYREQLGVPVMISPAPGALGRIGPSDHESDHNVMRWGRVLAVDVMPVGVDLEHAYQVARAVRVIEEDRGPVGFSAVGVYPDWSPRPGLHLGTRRTRSAEDPALWAGVRRNGSQVYTGIGEVFG